MRTIRLTVVALLAAGLLGSSEAADFRNVRWGMTILDVITAEGREPYQRDVEGGGYTVHYEGLELAGMPVSLAYGFDGEQGRLRDALYIFEPRLRSGDAWILDFIRLEKLLTAKYGEPIADEVNWRNPQYALSPDDYSFAISIGDLELVKRWETGRTGIVLRLDGENYKTGLSVYYGLTPGAFDVEKALDDL